MSGLAEVDGKGAEIKALCFRYGVQLLWLFGSALTENWDPRKSDFDFVVQYGPAPQDIGAFDQYFLFKAELSEILGKDVDLVEWDAVKNPFFQRLIERTRKPIFAA